MPDASDAKVLLVGSIPYDTVQEVFETFGAALGPHLFAIPDGEVGPRSHWISRVHYQVFAGHPELEILRRPRPDDGVERLNPHDASDGWMFAVRDGVDDVQFGNLGWRLGFARDAINSYFIFKTYREKGVLPPHLRFQVSIPTPNSVVPPRVAPDLNDLAKLRHGYTTALKAEIATIVEKIPSEDLAIQLDCATEIQDANGAIPEFGDDGAMERNLGQLREICPNIPHEVALGYHFCFGTLGGWPRFQPDDLGATVAFANAAIEASGRPVTWVHLPVTDTADETFLRPLSELRQQDTRVFLGLIHHMADFDRRHTLARKMLPEFGIGAYCGFGRLPGEGLKGILGDHELAVNKAA